MSLIFLSLFIRESNNFFGRGRNLESGSSLNTSSLSVHKPMILLVYAPIIAKYFGLLVINYTGFCHEIVILISFAA